MRVSKTATKNQDNEKTSTTEKPAVSHKKNNEIDSTYFDKFLKSTTEMISTPPDRTEYTSTTLTEDTFTGGVDFENLNTTDLDYKTLAYNYSLIFDQSSQDNFLENTTEFRLDVEEMFEDHNLNRTKRQNFDQPHDRLNDKKQTILVSCHNTGTFTSARQRWWYIALANCGSTKGINARYKFRMTNGPPGDFWHEHFSADEMCKNKLYKFMSNDLIQNHLKMSLIFFSPLDIPPVLLAQILAYTFLLLAVFLCGLELKTRQLYHCTYRLFSLSVILHWSGVLLNSVTWARYAVSGIGPFTIFGNFFTGASEIAFLLLMLLMAKGYTITRARLSTVSTVKITVFINLYIVVYISLYIYQAEVTYMIFFF